MELDAQTLKETYLGRVVLFYTKAPRVQAPIKRQADTLVQLWSRPILRKPADLRGRKIRSERELDTAPAADDVEMGGEGDEGEASQSQGQGGRSRLQGQGQSQSQSQARGGAASQRPKNKRVDWHERAQVNTTSKGARLEKAQVRLDFRSRLLVCHHVTRRLTWDRTSNTISHQTRNQKVKTERGMST